MSLFRGLKYALPIAILLWIAIFIAFKLIMQEEQHGLSNDKDDLNVTEMLIDIRERSARFEENTSNLDSTAIKASKTYSIAKENQYKEITSQEVKRNDEETS